MAPNPDDDDDRGEGEGETSGAPLSYLGALGWTFGLSGLTALIAVVATSLRPGGDLDVGTELLATAAATLSLLLAISRVHAPNVDLAELVGLRRVPVVLVVLALVAGAGLVFPLAHLDARAADRFPLDEELRQYLATDTLRQRVLLSLFALFGPLLVELFYRGALFGVLERDKPRGVVVFVVTALAVFPPSGHALFSALAVAAIASHLRGASGSVWPSLALRFGASAVGVAALLTRHDEDSLSRSGTVACLVAAALALALFFVFSRRRAGDATGKV